MSATPYAQRMIVLTIRLGTGTFGTTGQNTLTLGSITDPYACPRCSVHIEFASAPYTGSAIVTIYGLTLDHINQLTTPGIPYGWRQNLIEIQAGDLIAGLTTIYTGTILLAYPKASQPQMAFVMMSVPTYGLQLANIGPTGMPVTPTSFKGSIDGATVLSTIAKNAGIPLENNAGVSTVLSNPYFPGTAWEQLKACAAAMNVSAMYDPVKRVFAIWPKGGTRGQAGVISPATGMIDYPEFQQTLIGVRTLFDPGVVFTPGDSFNIEGSQFTAANGTWTTASATLDISAQMPDGPWEIAVVGARSWPGQS